MPHYIQDYSSRVWFRCHNTDQAILSSLVTNVAADVNSQRKKQHARHKTDWLRAAQKDCTRCVACGMAQKYNALRLLVVKPLIMNA